MNDGGYSRLFVRDRNGDSALETPALPEGVYTLDCQGMPARLAITVDGWKTPGSVFVWSLSDGEVYEAFKANLGGLDQDRLIRPESVTLSARDGVELQGLLYLPDENSRVGDGPPPVVFIVHGGPTGQARPRFRAEVQYHVDRGMSVFEPNVRGSTGFGHAYVTLDDREKRLNSIRDLVDMLAYLAGISVLPAPDGPLYTRRAAERTKLLSSHIRPAPEAVTSARADVRPTGAPAFRAFLRHRSTRVPFLRQAGFVALSPRVSLPAPVAPRSSAASRRKAAGSDALPPAGASSTAHASPAAPRSSPAAAGDS